MTTPNNDCGCNRALMMAVTPMHPKRYLDLACGEHRREFVAGSPVWADYVPDDRLRDFAWTWSLMPERPVSDVVHSGDRRPRRRQPNESRAFDLLAAIDRWYRDHPWAKTTTRPPKKAAS